MHRKTVEGSRFFFLRIKQKKGAMRFIVVFSGFFKRQPKSSSIRNVNPLSVWLNIHSFNEINPSARNKVLRTEELRGGFFLRPGALYRREKRKLIWRFDRLRNCSLKKVFPLNQSERQTEKRTLRSNESIERSV